LAAWVVSYRKPIALAGIVLVAIPVTMSGIRYSHHHRANVAPQMAKTAALFEALSTAEAGSELVASEDIAVNLMLPVRSNHETLLVSAFNNYVPEEEILDRLLLFAYVFNWTESQFLTFMMPDPHYDAFYADNNFILSPETLHNGFGYWLLKHRQSMNPTQLAAYQDMLRTRFARFDVQQAAVSYDLSAVQSSQPINPLLATSAVTPAGEMTIYYLEGSRQ
jgi:hypothetical protein